MTKYRTVAAGIILLAITGGGDLSAFEFETGHGPGVGGSVVLSKSSATALVAVPVGGIETGETKIELGALRRFNLKELDQAVIAVAHRWGRTTLTLGLAQLGFSDLYAEKTIRLGAAFRIDSLTVGAVLSARLISFGGGYDPLSSATVGVCAGYRTSRIKVAVSSDNLTSPRLSPRGPATARKCSFYLEMLGQGSFSILGRFTVEETERPQFGLGQKLTLTRQGAVFWGVSTAPLQYGGGFEVTVDHGGLTFATSYHPALGLSHSAGLSYRFGPSSERTDKP